MWERDRAWKFYSKSCLQDVKGVGLTGVQYEGDYYVPILSVDRTKGPYDQSFKSTQNFTTIAEWKPDPIIIGADGDSVTLWWGRYQGGVVGNSPRNYLKKDDTWFVELTIYCWRRRQSSSGSNLGVPRILLFGIPPVGETASASDHWESPPKRVISKQAVSNAGY